MYVLDTTVCVALIRGNKKVLNAIFEKGEENCFVSEMTIAELFYGASKFGRPHSISGCAMTLVTHDTKHFRGFPNLMIEDWK